MQGPGKQPRPPAMLSGGLRLVRSRGPGRGERTIVSGSARAPQRPRRHRAEDRHRLQQRGRRARAGLRGRHDRLRGVAHVLKHKRHGLDARLGDGTPVSLFLVIFCYFWLFPYGQLY